MNSKIPGLHHVTAIASDPQRNLDFYVGLLGLRFVKRTVNFDDPGSYHFYLHHVMAEKTLTRFGEEVIRFLDPDGLLIELIAVAAGVSPANIEPWADSLVAAEHHRQTESSTDADVVPLVVAISAGNRCGVESWDSPVDVGRNLRPDFAINSCDPFHSKLLNTSGI